MVSIWPHCKLNRVTCKTVVRKPQSKQSTLAMSTDGQTDTYLRGEREKYKLWNLVFFCECTSLKFAAHMFVFLLFPTKQQKGSKCYSLSTQTHILCFVHLTSSFHRHRSLFRAVVPFADTGVRTTVDRGCHVQGAQ
jgi:hypothetical protein